MPEKLWVGGVAQSVIRVAQSVIWWVVSYILVSLQSSLELEFGHYFNIHTTVFEKWPVPLEVATPTFKY